jgi:hypothetical protein
MPRPIGENAGLHSRRGARAALGAQSTRKCRSAPFAQYLRGYFVHGELKSDGETGELKRKIVVSLDKHFIGKAPPPSVTSLPPPHGSPSAPTPLPARRGHFPAHPSRTAPRRRPGPVASPEAGFGHGEEAWGWIWARTTHAPAPRHAPVPRQTPRCGVWV